MSSTVYAVQDGKVIGEVRGDAFGLRIVYSAEGNRFDHALNALGQSAATQYAYDKPDPGLLETFDAPDSGQHIYIRAPEFTSLCPKTGQPDFAEIRIWYETSGKCVESKSLKLYLGSFRNHGEFHESCVNRILDDLVGLLDPEWLVVQGRFTPRGGIPFWPVSFFYAYDVPDYVKAQLA